MSDKQKNSLLIAVFISLCIISYVFSIQKTIDLKVRLVGLEKEKELVFNASERILRLRQENKYLDTVLKQKELSLYFYI